MKKTGICLLCLLLMFNLASCTGARQLSERLIIQGIGIDKQGQEYQLTLLYLNTDDAAEEPRTESMSASGKSVMDCMTNSIMQTGKEPLYSQNLFILLGEKTAKAGFEEPLSFFTTYYESRPNVNIFVAKQSAAAIMQTKEITAQQIDMLSENEKRSGRAIVSTLMQMENDLLSGITAPKTLCLTTDGEMVQAEGTAVFQKDRLSFFLSPEESLGALMISGRADTASELILNEKGNVDFTLSNCKSDISPKIQGETLSYHIKISARADVYAEHKLKTEVQASLQERATQVCKNAIETCIKQHNADVFGFLKRLMQTNRAYFKALDDPMSALNKAEFTVTADIKVN